ncbi:MAG TPA: 2-isopropylmalate synthase [Nitrosopumilaceae archaeon]|nr:2-isopropylmalate synthase [Nitrosopumilaceae archaeon]
MKRYQKFIKKGINEPLSKVPFHSKAPIKRLSMLSKKLIPKSSTHVAVHFVNSKKKMPEYSVLHKHNHDEINLILSEDEKLTYQIQLEDEIYKVSSPSTVFIPKGINHKAKVISGKGIFVCIILK